jgi:hypothetical protein
MVMASPSRDICHLSRHLRDEENFYEPLTLLDHNEKGDCGTVASSNIPLLIFMTLVGHAITYSLDNLEPTLQDTWPQLHDDDFSMSAIGDKSSVGWESAPIQMPSPGMNYDYWNWGEPSLHHTTARTPLSSLAYIEDDR